MRINIFTDSSGYIIDIYDSNQGMYDYDEINFSGFEPDYYFCYQFIGNRFIKDQEKYDEEKARREAKAQEPMPQDIAEAQYTYTAMMTDTLLDE